MALASAAFNLTRLWHPTAAFGREKWWSFRIPVPHVLAFHL